MHDHRIDHTDATAVLPRKLSKAASQEGASRVSLGARKYKASYRIVSAMVKAF